MKPFSTVKISTQYVMARLYTPISKAIYFSYSEYLWNIQLSFHKNKTSITLFLYRIHGVLVKEGAIKLNDGNNKNSWKVKFGGEKLLPVAKQVANLLRTTGKGWKYRAMNISVNVNYWHLPCGRRATKGNIWTGGYGCVAINQYLFKKKKPGS